MMMNNSALEEQHFSDDDSSGGPLGNVNIHVSITNDSLASSPKERVEGGVNIKRGYYPPKMMNRHESEEKPAELFSRQNSTPSIVSYESLISPGGSHYYNGLANLAKDQFWRNDPR